MDVQQPVKEFLAPVPSIPGYDLTESMHFAVGASGITFGTDVAPTNTTLALPAKWTKTAASPTSETDKQIGVIVLETNAS